MSDLPQPLRRKPVQKAADSRYVSLFSDANNKSDITIRDGHKGLLPKSTKLYEVGIDNLTLSLNGLSMLTPSSTEPIMLEILALRVVQGQQIGNPATWPNFPADFRIPALLGGYTANAFQMLDSDTYTTFRQIEERLFTIGTLVTQTINFGFQTGQSWEWRNVLPYTAPYQRHLDFKLETSGRLKIFGSRAFWSYFCIHIPNGHYRSIFYGPDFEASDANQRIISLNPLTGDRVDRMELSQLAIGKAFTYAWIQFDASFAVDANGDELFEAVVSNNPLTFNEVANENMATVLLEIMLRCNLFTGLDHRVCIEVGTSLPMTHSSLIEDNQEKPDYSLGRFMINPQIRVYGSLEYSMHAPSTYELMSSDKRVVYHRLMPQEKVSVLRIQMYIRMRTYNAVTDTWSMKVSPLPTAVTDWWHCRLHFRELHEAAISQKQSPSQ